MSVARTLAAGRRAAEQLMTSTCVVTRKQEISLDTVTLNLNDLDPSDDLIYSGPCRLREVASRVITRAVEGQVLALQQLVLSLPVATSATIRVGDMVEITDGGPDPALVGRRYRIQGLHSQTQSTAHRFPIEEIS